ncbi:hypothetical protein CLOM_g18894 [Closterium sp. NIES-68]|nr:hypothetical protein CLOM_g18894 [Closterium sp. NIES-68]
MERPDLSRAAPSVCPSTADPPLCRSIRSASIKRAVRGDTAALAANAPGCIGVSPCKMPHDPLHRCAMAAADLAVVSTRVQPAPASGTVLDPRLLAVMRTVSASVDSAAAVDIVGGAVSALMLLGDYVKRLERTKSHDRLSTCVGPRW